MGLAALAKGGSLLLSHIDSRKQAKAAKRAGRRQQGGINRGIDELRSSGKAAIGALSPFSSAGERILDPLFNFVEQGPETEFERKEGFEAIQKSAAAGGKLRTGETLKALTEFSTGVDQRFRGQRFKELFGLATLGQQSASQIANLGTRTGENIANLHVGIGDVRAAATIGSANARSKGRDELGTFLGSLG